MLILGINAYHPDAGVALLKDGKILWAAEESKYNEIPHASGFPSEALKHCIDDNQVPPQAIDFVAISKNPRANLLQKIIYVLKNKPSKSLVFDRVNAFQRSSHFEREFSETLNIPPTFLRAKFFHVEHQQAHASTGFLFSGFEKAAFVCMDDMGDFCSTMWGVVEKNRLRILDRVFFPHSAGFLYTACSQFLGFRHYGQEYEVMNLAGQGEPVYLDKCRHMVLLHQHGQYKLNLSYFTHQQGQAKIQWRGGAPEQEIMYSKKWDERLGPPRPENDPVTDRDKNIAASIQGVYEDVLFHILRHLHRKTKLLDVCIAGTMAHNSLANDKITKETPFKRTFVQSRCGDEGTAEGAAAFVYYDVLRQGRAA